MSGASVRTVPRDEVHGGMLGTVMVAAATVAALGLLLFAGFATPAEAGTAGTATRPGTQRLFDDFDEIRVQPKSLWYRINWGAVETDPGQWEPERWEGVECGSDSCVTVERSGGITYADLSIFPFDHLALFTNAELAEQNTGLAAGEPGRWEPDPGRPVRLTARVRWSPNHETDGSGGAQGTSGIWLWNSPIEAEDYPGSQFGDLRAFGMSWTSEGSAVLRGLNASVVVPTEFGPYPVWSAAPERPVNLQRWNEISVRWKENDDGRQTVSFRFNGEYLGAYHLTEPFGPLSLEMWSDNQVPTPADIEYAIPTATQSFQVDYVEVSRR